MGPFEMMDLSGLDTFPHVTETLEALTVTPWSCPESVKQKIAEGKFGRKMCIRDRVKVSLCFYYTIVEFKLQYTAPTNLLLKTVQCK